MRIGRFMLTIAMLLVSATTILSYMGLAKFAVQTSAETEIVHELTFEPAHSKVGIGRTIPFDQDDCRRLYHGADARSWTRCRRTDMIAEFNAEVSANGQFEQMIQELKDQHLGANQPAPALPQHPGGRGADADCGSWKNSAITWTRKPTELPNGLGRAGDHG